MEILKNAIDDKTLILGNGMSLSWFLGDAIDEERAAQIAKHLGGKQIKALTVVVQEDYDTIPDIEVRLNLPRHRHILVAVVRAKSSIAAFQLVQALAKAIQVYVNPQWNESETLKSINRWYGVVVTKPWVKVLENALADSSLVLNTLKEEWFDPEKVESTSAVKAALLGIMSRKILHTRECEDESPLIEVYLQNTQVTGCICLAYVQTDDTEYAVEIVKALAEVVRQYVEFEWDKEKELAEVKRVCRPSRIAEPTKRTSAEDALKRIIELEALIKKARREIRQIKADYMQA